MEIYCVGYRKYPPTYFIGSTADTNSTKKFSTPARTDSSYNPLHTFDLPKGSEKHYQQQYADMYFLRLSMLKPIVEQKAEEAWRDFEVILWHDSRNKFEGLLLIFR